MGTVVKLNDNSVHVLFGCNDFLSLVYEKLGYDAELAFKDYIAELEKKADYTVQKVNTDLSSYEASLDSHTSAFNDILNSMEEIQHMIDNSLNRNKLQTIVSSVITEINNHI